jgi:hypothetical protein
MSEQAREQSSLAHIADGPWSCFSGHRVGVSKPMFSDECADIVPNRVGRIATR